MVAATETRQMTYQQAVNEALRIAMREDPTVVLMGEDVAGGAMIDHLANEDAWGGPMGVTKGLVQEFGRDRVLDTPITEAGFIGAAVGGFIIGITAALGVLFLGEQLGQIGISLIFILILLLKPTGLFGSRA